MNSRNSTSSKEKFLAHFQGLRDLVIRSRRLFALGWYGSQDLIAKAQGRNLDIEDMEDYILNGHIKQRMRHRIYKRSRVLGKTFWGSDASIGFTIPKEARDKIMDRIIQKSIMLKHIDIIETEADHLTMPTNHIQKLRWPGESPNPNKEVEKLPDVAKVLMHVALLTIVMPNSVKDNKENDITEEYIEANASILASYLDEAILYGSGQGQITGLYSKNKDISPSSLPASMVEINGAITTDSLIAVKNGLPIKYRDSATWIINKDVGLKIASMTDSMGKLICNLETTSEYCLPVKILGMPVIYNDYMDYEDITDGVPVMLVDLKAAYTLIRREIMSMRRFEDSAQAEFDQVLLLCRHRWGGNLTSIDAVSVLKVHNPPAFLKGTKEEVQQAVYATVKEITRKMGDKNNVQ